MISAKRGGWHFSKLLPVAVIGLVVLVAFFWRPSFDAPEQSDSKRVAVGTRSDRLRYFDEFVRRTRLRTAFSTPKWESLGTNFDRELDQLGLRQEFAEAIDGEGLVRAAVRLGNARRDRHVELPIWESDPPCAPIRFYPDLTKVGTPEDPVRFLPLFVANFDEEGKRKGLNRGDRLLAVNGIPIQEYLRDVELTAAVSTLQCLYLRFLGGIGNRPGLLSARSTFMPQRLFPAGDRVVYTVADVSSGEEKVVELRYALLQEPVDWFLPPIFPDFVGGECSDVYSEFGYRRVFGDSTEGLALWLNDLKQIALLECIDFDDVEENVPELVQAAERIGALRYDLVIDVTHCMGGEDSYILLRRLSQHAFSPTYGNLRIDDPDFVRRNLTTLEEDLETRRSGMDPGHYEQRRRQIEWTTSWVEEAIAADESYTTNEPFKFRTDRVIEPAEKRFTGNKVILVLPYGGSQLDQFTAMIIDQPNKVGIHSIGTTTGGYSNTWDWVEGMVLPGWGEVLVRWSVGQTIRPNAAVLEGNPARAVEWYPLTPDNASGYYKNLIRRGEAYLVSLRR